MKFKYILIFTTLTLVSIQAQEHGFIGGLSLTAFNEVQTNSSSLMNYRSNGKYDTNFHIGYLYRQLLSPKYMIDFYALIGNRTNTLRNLSGGAYMNPEGVWVSLPLDSTTYSLKYPYVSVGVIGSYKLWKGLRVGVGLEPTCYYASEYPVSKKISDTEFPFYERKQYKTDKLIFDVPLVIQLGYSFKYFELSASYKKGNLSLLQDANFRSLKTHDFQFSLFVPITNFIQKK